MGKDTFYFSHDYNARTDNKIKKLLQRHGLTGYGIYWALVEDLYNNANALPLDYECIAFDLRCDENVLRSVLNDFELFVVDDISFGSLSVQRRLDEMYSKSSKARESANKRWEKKTPDANALRTQSDPNAIKKEKELKELKEREESDARKLKFYEDIKPYKDKYPVEQLKQFAEYWTAKNKAGKMRFEKEEFFVMSGRLATWNKIEHKGTKNGKQSIDDAFADVESALLGGSGFSPVSTEDQELLP